MHVAHGTKVPVIAAATQPETMCYLSVGLTVDHPDGERRAILFDKVKRTAGYGMFRPGQNCTNPDSLVRKNHHMDVFWHDYEGP